MVRGKSHVIKYYQFPMDALDAVAGNTAQPYRVWCVEGYDVDGISDHRHVVAVETADADGRTMRWTLVRAIAAIRDGELFVVGGSGLGQATVVEPAVCPRCPQATLVSYPADALNDLPACL